MRFRKTVPWQSFLQQNAGARVGSALLLKVEREETIIMIFFCFFGRMRRQLLTTWYGTSSHSPGEMRGFSVFPAAQTEALCGVGYIEKASSVFL